MKSARVALVTVVVALAVVTVQGLNLTQVTLEKNTSDTVVKEICSGYSVRQLLTLYSRFHTEYGFDLPQEGIAPSLTIQTPVRGGSVQIASSSKCPNATQSDTLWCVRLASKAINATACLQPGGGVTTSKAGQLLKMAANMAVDLESGSLVIEVASEIYTYALVTAITTTEECISTTHSAIFLQKKKDIAPTLVKAPKDMIVSAGQNVSLTCSFSTSSEYHHMSWYKDNKPVAFILENPDCQTSNNDCQTDPRYSPDHQIRKSNVRAYTYTQRFCLQDAVHRHAVLVIDKAGGEDEGKYTCQLFGLSSVKPLLSVTMTLQVE